MPDNTPTKILLVDDEPDVKGMVKLKFRKQIRSGIYDFVFAENGLDALNKLEENPDINIVISDVNMPEMDGLTLLDRLKEIKRILKAIIVSAYGDMDNIRAAMNRGAYDFLTKPIDFEDLTVTIEKTRETVEDVVRNIESLNRAEKSLQESVRRNNAILNTAVDSIITIDEDGIIDSVNPATEKMFGYTREELIGENLNIIIPEQHKENHTGYIKEYLATGKRNIIGKGRDIEAERKDGSVFPIGISVSEFEIGERRMFTGIIRDISIRKKAEQIMLDYNKTLEKEVAERTRELVELNNEKNEILGIAAHDLKNPLSNIKMLAKVLNEDDALSGDDVREFSSDILNISESMFEMITNLLDVNAIEQGKINLNVAAFHLGETIAMKIEQYAVHAMKKDIKVHFDMDNLETRETLADKNAAMQIIDNLFSNAVKYSPQGKNVYLSVCEKDDRIIFSVKDEGPGISEEDQKKLFQKFAKLSAKPTGGENSTGLGLSIVKKLVELMDGKVRCESALGEGSNFIVELPAAEKQ